MGCRVVASIVSTLVLATPLFLSAGCGPSGDEGSPHPSRSSVGGSSSASSSATDVASGDGSEEQSQRGRDPEYGEMLYGNTCIACHGTRGQGMPNQGINLRMSKFVA